MPPLTSPSSTGLTITNPLVLYRALLATKQIEPDPSQHRLALHLQKLYYRLKDYTPQKDYEGQLKAVSKAVDSRLTSEDDGSSIATPQHPLRRNPLLSHLFGNKDQRDSLALTKILSNHEAAIKLDSPRGLMLHGEVGTGKSMLVDLLADSLPNRKKRRWHFNTFMLETISRLESLRLSRSNGLNSEYSLLWLAKDMIEKSPILFLDEFQLPDRAASKILSNLLTTFFQLGGVLIASSNRMPEELAKASGVEFAPPPPPPKGALTTWLRVGNDCQQSPFAGNSEFADFLEVLKARCEVWDMEGGRDWRRRDAWERELLVSSIEQSASGPLPVSSRSDQPEELRPPEATAVAPSKYFLIQVDTQTSWESAIASAFPAGSAKPVSWSPATLTIYGRRVVVPRQHDGVVFWNFDTICKGIFGPADYISMASTFHTFIIDEVPVLTLTQKNEARRLITLLDALYESKCKLVIRAEASPDELFFPETSKPLVTDALEKEDENDDAVYSETLSEIYQDQTTPFRPNISLYTEEQNKTYDPDEDSDFGDATSEHKRQVDFGQTSSFTGEDEKFAYKRARSRLWEMCGSRWHARSEPGWWRPLSSDVRQWERSVAERQATPVRNSHVQGDVQMGPSIELDEYAGMQGRDLEARKLGLFEERQSDAPRFGWMHAWGMAKWGKRGGVWGQGPEGLHERDQGKDKNEPQ